MKTVLSSTKAPQAVGPYSQAIHLNGTVFASGQLPIVPSENCLAEGIEAQTRQCLTNLSHVLEEAGLSLLDIVKTTVLLSNIKDFAAMNAQYKEMFDCEAAKKGAEVVYPARVCYEVAALPMGALVEIDCIAGK